jgi:hypothetical protein
MNITVAHKTQVARPLKVLIPMIQSELRQGDSAGQDHYRRAGEMLIEAKDQVGYGGWSRWLTKNFDLNHGTANRYMRWARIHINAAGNKVPFASMRELRGTTDRDREERQSKQQQAFKRVMRDVARDDFVQERQERKDEQALHQDLAVELVEIGYRALATRLHPDRGGTKDAMARLNRVRDELKHIAQTRRFV